MWILGCACTLHRHQWTTEACFWMHVTLLPYLKCDDCSKHILPSGRHIVSSGMTGFLCLPSPLNTLFPICRVWICYIVMDDVKQTTISLCSQQTLLMIRSRTDSCSGILSFWQVMTHNFWCLRCKPFPYNLWKKWPMSKQQLALCTLGCARPFSLFDDHQIQKGWFR